MRNKNTVLRLQVARSSILVIFVSFIITSKYLTDYCNALTYDRKWNDI